MYMTWGWDGMGCDYGFDGKMVALHESGWLAVRVFRRDLTEDTGTSFSRSVRSDVLRLTFKYVPLCLSYPVN